MSTLHSVKFVPPGGHRACANCSISKARCITPEGATKCERCDRLKKDCYPKTKSQRKRRQLADPAQDTASGSGSSHAAGPSLSPLPHAASAPGAHVNISPDISFFVALPKPTATVRPPQHEKQSVQSIMELAAAETTLLGAEAERLVAEFIERRTRSCLSIEFPPGASIEKLKQVYPLVFPIVAMAANYYDNDSQQRLFSRFLSFFVNQITQHKKKSYQMLAAIICLLDCVHVYKPTSPQQLGLIHLTLTMSNDLGLERVIGAKSPPEAGGTVTASGPFGMSENQHRPTLESCRALAACYRTICLFLMCMGLGPSINWALHWSPHLTEAIAELERRGGGWSTNDGYLAATTRLLQIVAQATEGHVDPDTGAPLPVDFAPAEAQLEEFSRSMPREFHKDALAMMEYHNARILLYKHSIPGITNSRLLMPSMAIPQREAQYRCLTAIRAMLRLYYSIPAHSFIHLPGCIWEFLQHMNVALGRLADLAAAQRGGQGGWPEDFVRCKEDDDRLWDFEGHTENMARRFEAATAAMMATGKVTKNDMFDRWAGLLRTAPGREPFQQPRGSQFAALDLQPTHTARLSEQRQDIYQFDPNAWASAPNDYSWDKTTSVSAYVPYEGQQQGSPEYPGNSQPGWYAPPPP